MGNGLRTQARRVLHRQIAPAYYQASRSQKQHSEPSLLSRGESSDPEQTDVLALCPVLPSTSREQAIVGDLRSMRGCFAWNLLLAVLFIQRQGSRRALKRL